MNLDEYSTKMVSYYGENYDLKTDNAQLLGDKLAQQLINDSLKFEAGQKHKFQNDYNESMKQIFN